MVQIKESCCCGSQFEISGRTWDSIDYRYREFLEAHAVCREKQLAAATSDRTAILNDHGILELNKIVKLYKNGKLGINSMICKIWNTAYKCGRNNE